MGKRIKSRTLAISNQRYQGYGRWQGARGGKTHPLRNDELRGCPRRQLTRWWALRRSRCAKRFSLIYLTPIRRMTFRMIAMTFAIRSSVCFGKCRVGMLKGRSIWTALYQIYHTQFLLTELLCTSIHPQTLYKSLSG